MGRERLSGNLLTKIKAFNKLPLEERLAAIEKATPGTEIYTVIVLAGKQKVFDPQGVGSIYLNISSSEQ